MTESAEYYITYFGGTILKEYSGVYLVKYERPGSEPRFAVVTYYIDRRAERSMFNPIPLFDVTITEEHAQFFTEHLPAMKRFCEDELNKEKA